MREISSTLARHTRARSTSASAAAGGDRVLIGGDWKEGRPPEI